MLKELIGPWDPKLQRRVLARGYQCPEGEPFPAVDLDPDGEPLAAALDPEDRESWVWNRGECDLGIYNVAAGGESDFLPEAYKPLFGAFPRSPSTE